MTSRLSFSYDEAFSRNLGRVTAAEQARLKASGYLPAALAPHIGLVLAEEGHGNVPAAALNAGRTMERVWLAAQAQGLALQPMAAATVLLA